MTEGERIFAITAPGLEEVTADEVARLGVEPEVIQGGVEWTGPLDSVYLANLHLRTASRVVVRAAEFSARTFFELERHARKVPWERYVREGSVVSVRVSSRKSRLYHEGAVAERLLRWIAEQVGEVNTEVSSWDDERTAGQLFVVRFLHDRCIISADSSGDLLHRRGYREQVAKAPLRETLAAAMLLGTGWSGGSSLVDPMCGSGTLPIEAALIARGIAPGISAADRSPRAFAFEGWPEFRSDRWERLLERAREEVLPVSPVEIRGSDRDEGAIAAAQGNAARAGVLDDLGLEVAPLTSAPMPSGPGLLVANPPYGVRVGEAVPLRNLYAAVGRMVRERLPGWSVALLTADRSLEGQLGLPLDEVLRTQNGGIPVRLMVRRG